MSTRSKVVLLLPLAIGAIFATVLPFIASATVNTSITNNVWNPEIIKGPLVICTGAPQIADQNGNLVANPYQCDPHNFCDLIAEIAHVVYFGIGIVIWILAPIMVALSGIGLVMSRGSPEARSTAKNRITRVAIGILITISAYLIISIFVSVLGVSGVGGFGAPLCSGTAIPANTAPTSTASQLTYGCISGGNYVCSQKADCSDVPGCTGQSCIQMDSSNCGKNAPWSTTNLPKHTAQADCQQHCYLPNTCHETPAGSGYYDCVQNGNTTPGQPVECPPGSGRLCAPPNVCQPIRLITNLTYECAPPPPVSHPSGSAPTFCQQGAKTVSCPAPKVCVTDNDIAQGWQTCEDPNQL